MASEAFAPAAVVALGMVTPLGHGAEASCAAIRAGLTRFVELPGIEVEGVPVIGAAVRETTGQVGGPPQAPGGLSGVDRFAHLAGGALREVVESFEGGLAAASLYLALPEPRPGLDDRLAAQLSARLGAESGIAGLAGRTRVFPSGHAGAVAALTEAMKDLQSRRVGRAIVGGVDSLVEPATVAHYHARGRLKREDRPAGLMPGEAAAFFLLEPLAAAEARRAPILAAVLAPATAIEAITIEEEGVCDASGLTSAGRRTLGALADGGSRIGLVIADLNGEAYRSEEYAYFVARTMSGEGRAPFRLWHPADSIGDTGAASAAVSLCVGARALGRGDYARTDEVLVMASSEGGLRGTVLLRRHPGKG